MERICRLLGTFAAIASVPLKLANGYTELHHHFASRRDVAKGKNCDRAVVYLRKPWESGKCLVILTTASLGQTDSSAQKFPTHSQPFTSSLRKKRDGINLSEIGYNLPESLR
jgi:hypothetical protein